MKNTPIRSSPRVIYLSVGSMILGILFIDIYGIIIKFFKSAFFDEIIKGLSLKKIFIIVIFTKLSYFFNY